MCDMGKFEEENKKRLGRTLKQLRLENGLTQQQVAEYLHIDRSTYSRYEVGREPEIDSLCALARLYDVSMDQLLVGAYSAPSDRIAVACSPKYDSVSDEEFLPLSSDEKRLLMYFRSCAHPSNIISFAKKLYVDDVLLFDSSDDTFIK